MHEGAVSTRLGLPGQPAIAEAAAVARDLLVAEWTGGRLHVAHLSTARALELVRRAKADGLAVTCEVTPHHLVLTDEEVAASGFSTRTKMNPPLREASDLDGARRRARRRHDRRDRDRPRAAPRRREGRRFRLAPRSASSGSRRRSRWSTTGSWRAAGSALERFVALFSAGPARAFGLPGGTLAPGSPADVTLFDPGGALEGRPAQVPLQGPQHAVRRMGAVRRARRDDRRRRASSGRGSSSSAPARRRAPRPPVPAARLPRPRGRGRARSGAPRRVAIRASADLPPAGARPARPRAARARGVEVESRAEGDAGRRRASSRRTSRRSRPRTRLRTARRACSRCVRGGRRSSSTAVPYRRQDEAICLDDPARPGRSSCSATPRRPSLSLAGRWLSSGRAAGRLRGPLGRADAAGPVRRRTGGSRVDRASDRDRIAQRDAFFGVLKRREARRAVEWEYPPARRRAAARVGEGRGALRAARASSSVRVYPGRGRPRRATRAPRAPADLVGESDGLRVDLDASAPAEPDLVDAGAGGGGARRGGSRPARRRPVLLSAAGARRAGRWWGRDVQDFRRVHARRGRRALDRGRPGLARTALARARRRRRGVLARRRRAPRQRGCRREGARQAGRGRSRPLLAQWRAGGLAADGRAPPTRRPLPGGVPARRRLRRDRTTIEDALRRRRRSREALGRLKASAGFGSIALRPCGARCASPRRPDPVRPPRRPRRDGRGTRCAAIGDAHAAGMTAMVEPRALVGGGVRRPTSRCRASPRWAGVVRSRTAGSSCTKPSWPRRRAPTSSASEKP